MLIPAWDEGGGHRRHAARHARALRPRRLPALRRLLSQRPRHRRRHRRGRRPARPRRCWSTPTARPPRPIASTISTARWPPTKPAARRAPRRSCSTMPRTSSTRSNSACSTGWSSAPPWSSSRSCRLPDPAVALDQRPLRRRIRREPHQGTGRARGGRRGDPARRGRLRDRARRARPARRGRMVASHSPRPA